MAVSQFTPVTFQDEPIYKDKLNTLSNNIQFVFERMPRITYNAHGVKKATGAKILAGVTVMPANSQAINTIEVYFGDFFSAGCKPVVITNYVAPSPKWRMITTHRGLGTNGMPDNRGMTLMVGPDYAGNALHILDTIVYVHWVAIGY